MGGFLWVGGGGRFCSCFLPFTGGWGGPSTHGFPRPPPPIAGASATFRPPTHAPPHQSPHCLGPKGSVCPHSWGEGGGKPLRQQWPPHGVWGGSWGGLGCWGGVLLVLGGPGGVL